VLVRSRRVQIAVVVGFLAATGAVAGVFALAGADPAVDGDVVLDEPGEFAESVDSVPVTGDVVPDVELLDADGTVHTLAELRGKPLVVNMWYSSCAPCAREVRDFAEVHRELGDTVQFLGVNPLDDADRMIEFAVARDVGYTLWRDEGLEFVNSVPVTVYPTTLFVDADGVIVHQTTAIDADELRALIADLF
jgi:peroxiredoxin